MREPGRPERPAEPQAQPTARLLEQESPGPLDLWLRAHAGQPPSPAGEGRAEATLLAGLGGQPWCLPPTAPGGCLEAFWALNPAARCSLPSIRVASFRSSDSGLGSADSQRLQLISKCPGFPVSGSALQERHLRQNPFLRRWL